MYCSFEFITTDISKEGEKKKALKRHLSLRNGELIAI